MRRLCRPFLPADPPSPKHLCGWIFFSIFLTAAACAQKKPPPIVEHPVEVRAIALDLPAEKHSLEGSSLRWLAGFDLEGSHDRFGGFSGLLLEDEHLLAISDRGWWWRGRLSFDGEGILQGVEGDALWPIIDLDGAAVTGRDRHDAEELAHFRGGFVVTFEGEHRFHFHARRQDQLLPTADIPTLLPGPPMEGIEENGGLEAVTALADGRLFALTEGGRNEDGHVRSFVSGSGGEELAWTELSVEETEDFKPTGAATLPSGDVLLVERSFNPLRGVRIRLARILQADIEAALEDGTRVIATHELGRLLPPLPVDNVEAVDVATFEGRTRIYLLVDDNFRSLQDTLLIQLELLESSGSVQVESAESSGPS